MATSDSEDFESADEEWVDEANISKKSVQACKNQAEIAAVTTDKQKQKTLVADNNTEVKVGVANTLENDCLKDIHSQTCSSGEPLNREQCNKVCQSESGLLQECEPKFECENDNLIDLNEDENKISDSKEEKELSSEIEVLSGEQETDGWDCEDEDVNAQLEENFDKGNLKPVVNNHCEIIEKEQSNASGSDGGSWGSWGSWGVTSLLSTATESVSTLTNQVSHGLSTVLETGLGVPDPEELVKQEIEEREKYLAAEKEDSEVNIEKEEQNTGLFGFGRVISGVSSITKLVETAGTKVVSGGLGTLETIGKKTMEVLQEGDPGLRKKRALFSDKVVLSQVLREAKEKAEQGDRALKNSEEARKVHFETLFDDFHGLVHLEALEMLSKQCNIKLQSVLLNTQPPDLPDLQESMEEIKDTCQLPDEEDSEGASFETLKTRLSDVGKGLGVPIANEKLVKTWEEIHQWLQECRSMQGLSNEELKENEKNPPDAPEIHQKAISTLARLTAEAVEQFHKTAELLLVCEKRNPIEEAKILLDMTSVFSLQVTTAATVFSENLNTCSEYAKNCDAVNSHITNVFLEAANSSSYIQEAFQLLIPVLQVGIVSS